MLAYRIEFVMRTEYCIDECNSFSKQTARVRIPENSFKTPQTLTAINYYCPFFRVVGWCEGAGYTVSAGAS